MEQHWFERLFGFAEKDYAVTRSRFVLSGTTLQSLANGSRYEVGSFSCPTVDELREKGRLVLCGGGSGGAVEVRHVAVASALEEHARHPGATFQAASQFNCLEFPSPHTTPEAGITSYAEDATQGPDCALACAAGSIVRNYLVHTGGSVGQSASVQLNNLDALEAAVDNAMQKYWIVRNGYVSTFDKGRALERLAPVIASRRQELLGRIKIGLHAGVGVNFAKRWEAPLSPVTVTQVYCSALSLGQYARGVAPELWEPLARLVLDAVYEATLWAAVASAARTGVRDVFLTFVGGGVFGNRRSWIYEAVGRGVATLEAEGARLTVYVCHFRCVDPSAVAGVDSAVVAARASCH